MADEGAFEESFLSQFRLLMPKGMVFDVKRKDQMTLVTPHFIIITSYISFRLVEMFQSTFSEYVVDELYGTGKSISPQIGITYAFDPSDNRMSYP